MSPRHDALNDEISRLADGIAALRVVHGLIKRGNGMTPAEIAKLTEQAARAKALMTRSSKSGANAKMVFDRYEGTLNAFDANVERVSKEDAALTATMAAMGNAGPVLEQAFQDGDAGKQTITTADVGKLTSDSLKPVGGGLPQAPTFQTTATDKSAA